MRASAYVNMIKFLYLLLILTIVSCSHRNVEVSDLFGVWSNGDSEYYEEWEFTENRLFILNGSPTRWFTHNVRIDTKYIVDNNTIITNKYSEPHTIKYQVNGFNKNSISLSLTLGNYDLNLTKIRNVDLKLSQAIKQNDINALCRFQNDFFKRIYKYHESNNDTDIFYLDKIRLGNRSILENNCPNFNLEQI